MPRVVATEDDWLMEGLQRFSEGGEGALKVEAIARTLGCSKSSFYWHFKSRKAFLSRMLSRWAELGTADVIARLETTTSPTQRLYGLLHEAFTSRQAGDFLFHLRRLARRDAQAAALLAETEQAREHYLATLLIESGMPPEDARIRADILYTYYLGWYERHQLEPVDDAALAALIDQLAASLGLPERGA